jgi:transposase-like protein
MGSVQRVHRGRLFWVEAVAAWEAGEESVAAFCRRRGLATKTFYKWRRRLEQEQDNGSAPALLPVHVVDAHRHVESEACSRAQALEVVVTGERRVRVSADFDPALLQRVVLTLEALSC